MDAWCLDSKFFAAKIYTRKPNRYTTDWKKNQGLGRHSDKIYAKNTPKILQWNLANLPNHQKIWDILEKTTLTGCPYSEFLSISYTATVNSRQHLLQKQKKNRFLSRPLINPHNSRTMCARAFEKKICIISSEDEIIKAFFWCSLECTYPIQINYDYYLYFPLCFVF